MFQMTMDGFNALKSQTVTSMTSISFTREVHHANSH